jgi:hypothetical protein
MGDGAMRSKPREKVCTINFQTTQALRNELETLARSQERTISAVIRLAIRAWLEERRSEEVR